MVDFRYHLVSIIAVFLALAVGIVVGTAALNGPVLDSLRGKSPWPGPLAGWRRTQLEAALAGLDASIGAFDGDDAGDPGPPSA